MKAVLVGEMPNEYADRYNVNEMYVWGLTVQDKHGYEIFKLVTDEPIHLRPLPHKLQADWYTDGYKEGFNACLDEIIGETE